MMEIIFHGRHDHNEAAESLLSIIRLFNERYHISKFREMHLSVTLVDEEGADVELVDSETDKAYRTLHIYRSACDLPKVVNHPTLKLVIDNTRS
jgi:hypothetical protein